MKKLKNKKDILNLIKKDRFMMRILQITRDLNLPDWWIGAGFVRNKVFDYLHGYKKRTKLNDVDIIYFDKKYLSERNEKKLQKELNKIDSSINWSVTNQARMSKFNGDKPYKSARDGLAHWNETATCIGIKLNKKDKLVLFTPSGVKDLVNLVIRMNPLSAHRKFDFVKRLKTKKWKEKWPKLSIIKI